MLERTSIYRALGAGFAVLSCCAGLVAIGVAQAQGVAQWPQQQPGYQQQQMPPAGYGQQMPQQMPMQAPGQMPQPYPGQMPQHGQYPQFPPAQPQQGPAQQGFVQQGPALPTPPPGATPVAPSSNLPPPVQSAAPAVNGAPPANGLPKERVEADVSTRSVAVTSSFTGTEIVIFGSVEHSRQPTAESGLYDIAIIVEGTPTPIIARKKSRVGGLWINTEAQTFDDVPSYYAIASTRPIEEISDGKVLNDNEIGFEHVSMVARPGDKVPSVAELGDFKSAVIRRKQSESLYQKSDYGVAFIGRSLFRSTIMLPANVPVGPLVTRVYLFKNGKLLSNHASRVNLQREGIERYLHDFAFDYPLFYGIFAVLIAVLAGLIASALFKKGSH